MSQLMTFIISALAIIIGAFTWISGGSESDFNIFGAGIIGMLLVIFLFPWLKSLVREPGAKYFT